MQISEAMHAAVRRRADDRCEYCHLPSTAVPDHFHIEHVVARQHHGPTALHNLALSCSRCNLFKGPNLAGVDQVTGAKVFLFDPRTLDWADHFRREGGTIIGLTPIGRVTVDILAMNDPDRVLLRALLIEEGRLPPVDGR